MRKRLASRNLHELLTRNVAEIIGRQELERGLRSRRRLRVKFGVDPTGNVLHLGHAIILWKLREFQDFGHRVIFVIGDFTGQIGDPSGRLGVRQALTLKEVNENWRDYQRQAAKIINWRKVEVRRNLEWYKQMSLGEFFGLMKKFTVDQILERDMFQERRKKRLPIWTHEFLYPILQGYDSVALRSDVEIGGSDQLFNMLRGRDLQIAFGQKPQAVITTPLLLGTDGRKMSKSFGNTINITDPPNEQFGKVMSIADELVPQYFELATRLSTLDIQRALKQHPREAKARLAEEIVTLYHGSAAAKRAAREFERIFRKKEVPQKLRAVPVGVKFQPILDLLLKTKLASSKSEAKRLVEQGAVEIDGEVVKNWQMRIVPVSGMTFKVGKRRFAKLKVK